MKVVINLKLTNQFWGQTWGKLEDAKVFEAKTICGMISVKGINLFSNEQFLPVDVSWVLQKNGKTLQKNGVNLGFLTRSSARAQAPNGFSVKRLLTLKRDYPWSQTEPAVRYVTYDPNSVKPSWLIKIEGNECKLKYPNGKWGNYPRDIVDTQLRSGDWKEVKNAEIAKQMLAYINNENKPVVREKIKKLEKQISDLQARIVKLKLQL